jgi:hypothetical protein
MRIVSQRILLLLVLLVSATLANVSSAHHVLGRPAYNLNEDSNTPSSIQDELAIGNYTVTYMVFPAFPKPQEPGRINLYVKRNTDNASFKGKVTFTIREDGGLPFPGLEGKSTTLGTQAPDDSVFRQSFAFHKSGKYLVSASFEAGGEPYLVDFPLQVGAPAALGMFEYGVGALLIVLVTVSLVQRRRAMTGKVRGTQQIADAE